MEAIMKGSGSTIICGDTVNTTTKGKTQLTQDGLKEVNRTHSKKVKRSMASTLSVTTRTWLSTITMVNGRTTCYTVKVKKSNTTAPSIPASSWKAKSTERTAR